MPKEKHKSGATKKDEKKWANQLIASQRSALNTYFSATNSVDVHFFQRQSMIPNKMMTQVDDLQPSPDAENIVKRVF
jgi:hypothetical protein